MVCLGQPAVGGSGGMHPQEILRILGILRCVLVHSEANFNTCTGAQALVGLGVDTPLGTVKKSLITTCL